jgi:predicted nucleotidyltransferase
MDAYISKIVCKLTKTIVGTFRKELLAVVVAGSAATGEETWINAKMISDVDIFLITKRRNPFLESRVAWLVSKSTRDFDFEVTVGCVRSKDLRKTKDLEHYEAMKSGEVVWGVKDIFQCVPIKSEKDIPRWEGIRLLFNRAMDLTQAFYGRKHSTYTVAKSYLAIGQAYLIFDGRYRSSYSERLDEILKKCDLHIINDFIEKFRKCSQFKMNRLDTIDLSINAARTDLLKALNYFLSVYVGSDKPLCDSINILSKRFYCPSHALEYFLRKLGQKKVTLRSVFREPCFIVWSEAIKLLKENSHDNERMKQISEDWRVMPQFKISSGGQYRD